jgi:hypothetical protein
MTRTLLTVVSVLAVSLPAAAQTAAPPRNSPPVAAIPEMPTLGGIVRKVPTDFRNVIRFDSAVILGVAGGIALAVHPFERHAVASAEESHLDEAFDSGGVFGSGWAEAGGAVATYAVGRVAHAPGVAAVGADLIRAQFLNFAMTTTLKVAVDRRRPDGGSHSFPSGHTSATFTTATVLQQHFGWRAGVPAFAIAAYVGGQRLQEDAHYVSDVIFGAAIGVVSGRAVTHGHHSKLMLTPTAGRHAAGVTGVLYLTPAR